MPHINAPSAIIHIVTRRETIRGDVVIKYCADDETIIVGHATW